MHFLNNKSVGRSKDKKVQVFRPKNKKVFILYDQYESLFEGKCGA